MKNRVMILFLPETDVCRKRGPSFSILCSIADRWVLPGDRVPIFFVSPAGVTMQSSS